MLCPSVVGAFGPRLCENAKTMNRDRTSSSLKVVFGVHIASAFNCKIELENIILVALRTFEFSYSLGPTQNSFNVFPRVSWSGLRGPVVLIASYSESDPAAT